MLKSSYGRDEVMVMDAYVNRCMFRARYVKGEGELVYDLLKFYGCGLCVPTCPTHTIKMTRRDELE